MNERVGDKPRLLHILEAITEIESYVQGIDATVFRSNSMLRFASIKQLEIIGEASRHLSDEIKKTYPTVEWSQIIGLRNILIHEYFGIDSDLIWQIVVTDLPLFKAKISHILKNLQ